MEDSGGWRRIVEEPTEPNWIVYGLDGVTLPRRNIRPMATQREQGRGRPGRKRAAKGPLSVAPRENWSPVT